MTATDRRMRAVREIHDPASIARFLERDPIWSCYAITDLDEPYRQYATYIGALDRGSLTALLLVYQAPQFTSLLPFGADGDVKQIVDSIPNLPATSHVLALDNDLPSLFARYRLNDRWDMDRMAVNATGLRPVYASGYRLERLRSGHATQLATLYARYQDAIFDPSMLAHGIYAGAFEGDHIVAVAGTHTLSMRYRIVTIGGVFTLPEYRGRGLATALTAMVAEEAVARGVDLLALNVRRDNVPAIRAYQRLGFQKRQQFVEGHVTLEGRR